MLLLSNCSRFDQIHDRVCTRVEPRYSAKMKLQSPLFLVFLVMSIFGQYHKSVTCIKETPLSEVLKIVDDIVLVVNKRLKKKNQILVFFRTKNAKICAGLGTTARWTF